MYGVGDVGCVFVGDCFYCDVFCWLVVCCMCGVYGGDDVWVCVVLV